MAHFASGRTLDKSLLVRYIGFTMKTTKKYAPVILLMWILYPIAVLLIYKSVKEGVEELHQMEFYGIVIVGMLVYLIFPLVLLSLDWFDATIESEYKKRLRKLKAQMKKEQEEEVCFQVIDACLASIQQLVRRRKQLDQAEKAFILGDIEAIERVVSSLEDEELKTELRSYIDFLYQKVLEQNTGQRMDN